MRFLFIIGIITYALARATQQGSLFAERCSEVRHEWLANPNQIHFYGWFEPIGLAMMFMSLQYAVDANNACIYYAFIIPAYFVYWLPYALLYCHIRRKDWFNHNQMYEVGWIKTYLLNKPVSILYFIFSLLTILILWK